MSGISVAPGDPNATQVRASYKLGSTPVSTVFNVVKVANTWKLAKVVNDLSVGAVRQRSVPMKVNGASVSGNTVRVLPGSYAFSTGTGTLSYGKRNVVLVNSPTDLVTGVYQLRPQLTSSGIKKVRAAARNRWNDCLDSRSPRPKNCPFQWTNKTYRYITGGVNWRRSGADPFKKARFLIDAKEGPAMTMPFVVKISGDCRYRGQRGTCRGTVTGTAAGKLDLTRSAAKFDWL